MNALDELYQEVILQHGKKPRNFGVLERANRSAQGHNPLCGDSIHLTLEVEDGLVRSARFTGAGCAISTASASLMTEAIAGKSIEEVERLCSSFERLVVGGGAPEPVELGKLAVLAGVRRFPLRVKCAMLAWRTLQAALSREPSAVTTEQELQR